MAPTKILGIAASLRNARWGAGNEELVSSLSRCATEKDLKDFLSTQGNIRLQDFVASGTRQGRPFDEVYSQLKQLKGDDGLSNSEIALAAALWSAQQAGSEVRHLSLAEHFPFAGSSRRLDELREALDWADGILVSGPVYFGDRGSLAQELIDFMRDDAVLCGRLAAKVYGGIAVGAKRNGGQETTLIYQMLDMLDLGCLCVGNDSDTTSQYGGTGHAGDVGTMARDDYGLWTSMGTGRRLAHVTRLMHEGAQDELKGRLRLAFWILQEQAGAARTFVDQLCSAYKDSVDIRILDLSARAISRCIACDICPTHIDIDEEYRCIIKGKQDDLSELHPDFLFPDAVIPVAYVPRQRKQLVSVYQRFIERTRYLRRGDYVLGDCLVAPLVLEDIKTNQNMSMRMVTSMVRHHMVLAEPMVARMDDGRVLNTDQISASLSTFIDRAVRLTIGRLRTSRRDEQALPTKYNPVGYILSAAKDKEDEKLSRRKAMIEARDGRKSDDAASRL